MSCLSLNPFVAYTVILKLAWLSGIFFLCLMSYTEGAQAE